MARKRVLNAADWRGPSGVKAVCAALARYQNCPSPPRTTNASWLPGAQWLALSDALGDEAPLTAALNVAARLPGDQRVHLRQQLRELLHYHCGVGTLRTRQLMMDLQSLQVP